MFRFLFKKKKEITWFVAGDKEPKPGEYWTWFNDNPFDPYGAVAYIYAVKKGYVLYSLGKSNHIKLSTSIMRFKRIYTHHNNKGEE